MEVICKIDTRKTIQHLPTIPTGYYLLASNYNV